MKVKTNLRQVKYFSLLGILFSGCITKHLTSTDGSKDNRIQIGEFQKGDLSYEIFRLDNFNQITSEQSKLKTIKLSVRIINKGGGQSPLRAISNNLDEYNSRYSYLLNNAKNDLIIKTHSAVLCPVYYSFENNYNAFPFETINVGYELNRKQAKGSVQLIFVDKIFTQDSIFFNLKLK
ncbi:MAG: hypothetical protein WC716_12425 [Chitinophagaceae bacterium]|jgi:hypothetical protein